MIACFEKPQPLSGADGAEQDRQQVVPAGSGESQPEDDPCEEAATDFGGVVYARPKAVIRPACAGDVARAIVAALQSSPVLTVAARGNGHSVSGQATAEGGLVLDMRALSPRMEFVRCGLTGATFADVSGGALWEEVLLWGIKNHGMVPVSWTDYLRLTVGGTLSNGGVSGQAFRHGPQVSNVTELEVVTGDGLLHVCSPSSQPDLFFAVLGGLAQFGVITRARIPLFPAPRSVKWIRVVYGTFEEYSGDAELLVTRSEPAALFDYVEGFAFVNSADPINGWPSVPVPASTPFDPSLIPAGAGPLLYSLELALCYDDEHDLDSVDKRVREMLRPLRYVRGLEFAADVSYVEFLSRVNRTEDEARSNGSWAAPHPWLNIFVAAADIADFAHEVFDGILRNGVDGPMLVYPLLRSKWDSRTSVALPADEVFYLVALLRLGRPYPDGAPLDQLLAENREIVKCCAAKGYDFKLYFPNYDNEADWARHFAGDWSRFRNRKARYDPMAILAPGQKIFSGPLSPIAAEGHP